VRDQNSIRSDRCAYPIDIVLQQTVAGVDVCMARNCINLLSPESQYDFVFESLLLAVVTGNINHQQSLIGFRCARWIVIQFDYFGLRGAAASYSYGD
jgi:hypothetical protein